MIGKLQEIINFEDIYDDHYQYNLRRSVLDRFYFNAIKYETSFYFDDRIDDIYNDHPMIANPRDFVSLYDARRETNVLNEFMGGYLNDLDLTKTLITGSAICATISAIRNHIPPEVLFGIYYPSLYTRIQKYNDEMYLTLIIAKVFAPETIILEKDEKNLKIRVKIDSVLKDHIKLSVKQIAAKLFKLTETLPEAVNQDFYKTLIGPNFKGFLDDERIYRSQAPAYFLEETRLSLDNDPKFIYEFDLEKAVDVDIAIDTENDKEFDTICKRHFSVINKYYPNSYLIKQERSNDSYIYEVLTENYADYELGFRNVQFFKGNRFTISKFHLPMVRGWYDDTHQIHCTNTCALSHDNLQIRNLHFFKTKNDKARILTKYISRGFDISRIKGAGYFYGCLRSKFFDRKDYQHKNYQTEYLQFDYNIEMILK